MKQPIIILCTIIFIAFSMPYQGKAEIKCNTGGEGATSCTDAGTYSASLLFGLISWEVSYENSISCGDGYYACCNADGAWCLQ